MRQRITRIASGFAAVAAAIAFVGVGPAGLARADEPVDQISGNGDTTSALTVAWSQGLLGADNHTVVGTRDPDSPWAFMYPDFQNLKVTVSQTQSLVHQAIVVKWSGGKPTLNPFRGNFLQLMQCYGDANTGPTPESCEYGSAGLLPNGVLNPGIGTRQGVRCTDGAQPSTSAPPGTKDGSAPSIGCDPREPSDLSHLLPCPTGQICLPGPYTVPFVPVNTNTKVYGQVTSSYDQFSTNEVQEANTSADGTGQSFFQVLTEPEAPGLGCGLLTDSGAARGCWLVIVPRGEFKPNGWHLDDSSGSPGFMTESPLGASTWAQRIQIHLGFAPLGPNCDVGSASERRTVGTQLISRAVFSWQLALNTASNCRTIYSFAATPEPTNTNQLASDLGAGLAFTTIPIGSEAARLDNGGSVLSNVIYAPVTASALTFGFNINQADGLVSRHIKLTPRLMAKALTQSYRFDLPDVDSNHPGPDWARNNPNFLTDDPEFQKLNPGIATPPSGSPLAPLVSQDHSAVNQQIWAWIQSDPAARTWLSGTPDENNMVVNPHYAGLNLSQAPAIDSYPRADPTCFNTGAVGERDPGRCSLDLLPFMQNFDDVATRIRAANNPEGASWDPSAIAPDNSVGWWGKGGVEPAGRVFLWGVMGSADLANLGLVPADLCNAAGTTCAAPNTASVAAALAGARADSAGLLHVDPAAPGSGAYPLVSVTYAAVKTDQAPAALADYAALINYAAGSGQSPGVDPGQLPRGFLPLPEALRAKARSAAATLLNPATTAPAPATSNRSTVSGNGGSRATTPAATATANPTPYTITTGTPKPVARVTGALPLGPVRWALLVVVLVGLAGAVGGSLLRIISTAMSGRRS